MPDEFRITGDDLLGTIETWDGLMDFRVCLIAVGGTAMTLLGIKESTKDVDFTVPIHKEYVRLLRFLAKTGYRESEEVNGWVHPEDPLFVFQFFPGNRVFTTDLLYPPLEEGNHILIRKYRHIYLGTLNLTDLIITKIFRGDRADIEDCVQVFSTGKVKAEELLKRYLEAASYNINPEKVKKQLIIFVGELSSRQLVGEGFLERVRSCR
jgi:hypothetical protein